MTPFILDRRRLLTATAGLALAGAGGRLAFAATAGRRKFVLVILRGAMDGLAAVVPYADPNYRALRGGLALSAPGETDGVLRIADGFGLHPKLSFLHDRWRAGELAVLHAAASPYRERSHFDGQDVLESGADRVFATQEGWLNRAVGLLPGSGSTAAVAVGGAVPLVLRGPASVSSWAPSVAPAAQEDTLIRLTDLYAGDPLLSPVLAHAVETQGIVGQDAFGMRPGGGRSAAAGYRILAAAAAKLLASPNGPAAAVISFDGWDTHAGQGAAAGALSFRLQGLDAALRTLKDGLGAQWKDTVVVVATEFGRTVAENGTGGTDHGTGGVALALGGAVKGGRMIGDWPTLAPAALHQGRDLAPANDVRELFATVLQDHWGIDRGALIGKVFPDSAGLKLHTGLIA